MLVKQELAKETDFLTVYLTNLDIKQKNRITPLKAISPEVLKFRYFAIIQIYQLVSKDCDVFMISYFQSNMVLSKY